MDNLKRNVIIFLFINIITIGFIASIGLGAPVPTLNKLPTVGLDEINNSNIVSHIQNLSSIPTRVTGYPGCEQAAQYITEQFHDLGLRVEIHEHPILVPIDHGANITVLTSGMVYEAYPLWPNMIQCSPTPPGGITGHLIYTGLGNLEEFDDKEVEGSIVLMEFNSLYNWINAAKLGAKAVIFIEPMETTRMEAESKVILTPIYFPRVYVSKDVGQALRLLADTNVAVNLKSSMKFEWRTAKNIIGVLEGETDGQIIILAAHYDSWSPVPSRAPDAFDAVQTASLLEVARVLSARKPMRTVWFVAFSGHYQSVTGAREFVEKYYFQNETYYSGQKRFLAFIDLELATDGILMTWDYILSAWAIRSQETFNDLILREYIPGASKTLNLPIDEYVLPAYLRDPFEMYHFSPSFDSEPVSCSAQLGFSFITMKTLKTRFMVPTNEIDKIELTDQFVNTQIKFVLYTLDRLANDDLSRYNNLEWRQPAREYSPPMGGGSAGAGLVTLTGRVDLFNFTKGFYTPVPNALVVIHRYSGGLGHEVEMARQERHHPIWSFMITQADENGKFSVNGLEHWMTGQASAYKLNILAFVVDPDTGRITHAPERGVYGGGGGIFGGYAFLNIQLDRHPYVVKTVVFECRSLTMFDMFDPYTVLSPRKRINSMGTLQTDLPSITLNEFTSHTRPMSWGAISPQDTGEPLSMVFVPPEMTFEVVLSGVIGGASYPGGILNNANETVPMGTGLRLKDESGIIPNTALKFFEGLYWLTNTRHSTLSAYHVLDPIASEWHDKSYDLWMLAKEMISNHQYSRAYEIIYNAWNMEVNAYRKITGMAKDVINTSAAFYILLFPFAFALEFLVFMERGKKRLITIISTFAAFIVLAYMIHPGFRLAFNFSGSFIGLSVLVAAAIVIGVIGTQAISFGKRLRSIMTGLHYTEISRTGALFAAFSVGVQNMRKRKLRSILTTVSIILLTSSFVALTSASAFSFIRTESTVGETIYNGMLLTKRQTLQPFTLDYYYYVSSIFPGAKIIPRAWYFPEVPTSAALQPIPRGVVYSANKSYVVSAVVGLTPEEQNLTHIDGTLEGRWFIEQDIFVCILPKPVADGLSVKVGDKIDFLGVKYKVIGISDDLALKSILDLDQGPLFPRYPLQTKQGLKPYVIFSERFIIVPYNTVMDVLDGQIYTISVLLDDEETLKAGANRIIRGSWGLYEAIVGFNGDITIGRVGAGYEVSGLTFLTIPFVIASLVIFTTVLGSIYERTREITIYSSVGLSPLHVMAMFLAETVTYAVVGGVVGYLIGVIGIDIFLILGGIPPGLNLNLSSSIVFITIGISFISTMLASVYPSIKVGRLVTPSLERKWKIKTKPLGDEWDIPLPFFANTREETRGVMVFMKEFLDIYISPEVGEFWVKEPVEFEEEEQSVTLSTTVALTPYDSGFTEKVRFIATREGDKPFTFEIFLRYAGGERHPWTDSNPRFADNIRKQLLLWRGLKQEERDGYIRRGEESFRSLKSKSQKIKTF